MNILFLSSTNYLRKSGGGLCTNVHKEIIDKIGDDVGKTYFLFFSKEPLAEVYDKLMYIKSGGVIKKFFSILRGYSPRMNCNVRRKIFDLIESKKIDTLYIDSSLQGKYIKEVKLRYPSIKVIAFFHNIEGVKMKQDKGFSIWRKMSFPIQAKNERDTARWADRNIVLNKRDANLYKQLYKDTPFAIIPVGVAMPSKIDEGRAHKKEEVLKMIFVGSGDYPPNVHSIEWFTKMVIPLIKKNVLFYIIGKNMEKHRDVFESASDMVKVVGTVDDLAPHYIDADIIIAPLIEGGGMKIKTAEAFSYGKHFIGTTEGLEGYWEEIPDSLKGKKIFRCDDPKEFAATIDSLAAQDFDKYDADIRKLAEEKYSFDSSYDCFSKVFNFEMQ